MRTLLIDVAHELLRLTAASDDGQLGPSPVPPLKLDAIVRCLSRVRGVEEAVRLALPPPPVPPRRHHGRSASGNFSAGDFTPKRAVPSLPGSGEVGRTDSLGTQEDLSPHDPFVSKMTSDILGRVRWFLLALFVFTTLFFTTFGVFPILLKSFCSFPLMVVSKLMTVALMAEETDLFAKRFVPQVADNNESTPVAHPEEPSSPKGPLPSTPEESTSSTNDQKPEKHNNTAVDAALVLGGPAVGAAAAGAAAATWASFHDDTGMDAENEGALAAAAATVPAAAAAAPPQAVSIEPAEKIAPPEEATAAVPDAAVPDPWAPPPMAPLLPAASVDPWAVNGAVAPPDADPWAPATVQPSDETTDSAFASAPAFAQDPVDTLAVMSLPRVSTGRHSGPTAGDPNLQEVHGPTGKPNLQEVQGPTGEPNGDQGPSEAPPLAAGDESSGGAEFTEAALAGLVSIAAATTAAEIAVYGASREPSMSSPRQGDALGTPDAAAAAMAAVHLTAEPEETVAVPPVDGTHPVVGQVEDGTPSEPTPEAVPVIEPAPESASMLDSAPAPAPILGASAAPAASSGDVWATAPSPLPAVADDLWRAPAAPPAPSADPWAAPADPWGGQRDGATVGPQADPWGGPLTAPAVVGAVAAAGVVGAATWAAFDGGSTGQDGGLLPAAPTEQPLQQDGMLLVVCVVIHVVVSSTHGCWLGSQVCSQWLDDVLIDR